MKRKIRHALIVLALLSGLSCASAGIDSMQHEGANRTLPLPPVFLVYDFAVSPGDALADNYGHHYAAPQASSSDDTKAKQLAASLSRQLVDQLNKKGVNARGAADTENPPLNAIVLRGHFVTIDEGNRIARMVIGFGAGATELRVAVQVYQAEESGLRRLAQAEASAAGNKMPGMAAPVGVGALAGNAARSAAISGGMNVVQEVTGGLDSDAGNLAKKLAERAASFYKRQGWL
jgi:hypothetical protein